MNSSADVKFPVMGFVIVLIPLESQKFMMLLPRVRTVVGSGDCVALDLGSGIPEK